MGNIILENSHLKLEINDKNGLFTCLHKGPGVAWDSDPWKQSLGTISFQNIRHQKETVSLSSAKSVEVEQTENSVKMVFGDFNTRIAYIRPDRALGKNISATFEIVLHKDKPEFTFAILDISVKSDYWSFASISAPQRAFSVKTVVEDGYYLINNNYGSYIPSKFDDGHFRYLNWIWGDIANKNHRAMMNTMNWYAAAKNGDTGSSGFTCIIEDPIDGGIDMHLNNNFETNAPYSDSGDTLKDGAFYAPRLTGVTPIWLSSQGSFNYSRTLTYRFIENPTIGSLAKIYRKYAIEKGFFVSLKDKIAKNPNIKKLIGGPDIKTFMTSARYDNPNGWTWSSVVGDGHYKCTMPFSYLGEIAAKLKAGGVTGGYMNVAGWTTSGYDINRPIDTLPLNADAGGEEAFKAAAKVVKEAGMLLGVHDNYRNFDLTSPSYDATIIDKDPNGNCVLGFTSDGGPSHQICTSQMLPLLKRTAEYMAKTIGVEAYFLDTTASIAPYECYDPNHPMSRTDDINFRNGLFKYLGEELGLVVGSEVGTAWSVPYCAFMEGQSNNAQGINAPLWQLVFHDACIVYKQHYNPYNYEFPRGSLVRNVLIGLVYGNSTTWCVAEDTFPGWENEIIAIHKVVNDFHSRIALEELLDFDYLSNDLQVMASKFGDGTRVVVNCGSRNHEVEWDGVKFNVPYRGFCIQYPKEDVIVGRIKYSVEVE